MAATIVYFCYLSDASLRYYLKIPNSRVIRPWEKYCRNNKSSNTTSWDLLRRSTRDMDPAAIAERDRVNRNWADILYQGAPQKRAY